MARKLLPLFFVLSIFSFMTPPSSAFAAVCGGAGQNACISGVPAKYMGDFHIACTGGSFFDPRNGGECWSCPEGSNRTVHPVTSDQACSGTLGADDDQYAKAHEADYTIKLGCQGGSFYDPIDNGSCWNCPSGYHRTAFSVKDDKACAKGNPEDLVAAKNHGKSQVCGEGEFFDLAQGGTCWSCPDDYNRTAFSVKSGQACSRAVPENLVGARKSATRPGCETGTFFDGRNGGECWSCPVGYKRTAYPVNTDRACTKALKGEEFSIATKANYEINLGCPKGSFFDLVDGGTCWSCVAGSSRTAYHVEGVKACVKKTPEKLAGADNKGGTQACARGTFYDPIDGGTCWSCPSGFNRTLYPVKNDNACSKAVGEKLASANYIKKSGCGSGQFADLGKCWSCPSGFSRDILRHVDKENCAKSHSGYYSKKNANHHGKWTKNTKTFLGTIKSKYCKSGWATYKGKCWKCPGGYSHNFTKTWDTHNMCEKYIGPWTEYKQASNHGSGNCDGGSFYDLIDGGTCWKCPSKNPRRTAYSVKSNSACVANAYEDFNVAHKEGPFICPEGTFFDPIDGGSCWSCDKEHPRRTAFSVKSNKACVKDAFEKLARATREGEFLCPPGTFFDPIDGGSCWSCKDGYNRTAHSVKDSKACVRAEILHAATLEKRTGCPKGTFNDPIDGGTCWSCDSGHPRRTAFAVDTDKACVRDAYEKLTRAKKEGPFICPEGTFFDPISGGFCWSCDSDHPRRTAFSVKSNKACVKDASEELAPATKAGAFLCPQGTFFDPIDGGSCWSCPTGFHRTATHVESEDACERTMVLAKAKFEEKPFCPEGSFFDPRKGGECWSCPAGTNRLSLYPIDNAKACSPNRPCEEGFYNIRGKCYEKNRCGNEGERPCLLIESFPSCKGNTWEDFDANLCVGLEPGQTPFLAGLGSFSDYMVNECESFSGRLLLDPKDKIDGVWGSVQKGNALMAAQNCGAKATTAFMCAPLGEIGKIKGYTDYFQAASAAYIKNPCKGVTFSHARKVGGSAGLECEHGFFDFIDGGTCWSCPQGKKRSWYSVDSDRACYHGTEPFFRAFCAVLQPITGDMKSAEETIQCFLAAMQEGNIVDTVNGQIESLAETGCKMVGKLAYKAMVAALTGVYMAEGPEGIVKEFLEKRENLKLAKKKEAEEKEADKTKGDKAKEKAEEEAKGAVEDVLKTIQECSGLNL